MEKICYVKGFHPLVFLFFRPCVCYVQTRGRRFYRRPLKDRVKPWHIEPSTKTHDEKLTAKNEAFLKAAAVEYYNSQSPLQNEPWPRNNWTTR